MVVASATVPTWIEPAELIVTAPPAIVVDVISNPPIEAETNFANPSELILDDALSTVD